MRIGLDIDGVLYKWEKTARYMLREVLPDSPYKEPITFTELGEGLRKMTVPPLRRESDRWDYIKAVVSPEHWDWLWTEGIRLGLFRYGHLYPGTIQAVRRLAEIGEVVLITHRPKQAVTDTLAWLGMLNLPISGLHLLTNGENKGLVRPGFDVFVDDKPENVQDVLDHSDCTNVILMRRLWNRDFNWQYGMTVGSLQEVCDVLQVPRV